MSTNMPPILELSHVFKTFTLHLQGGLRLAAVNDVTFTVTPGECVVLSGPSGAGKSSILKMIYGNYRCDSGSIRLRQDDIMIDVVRATPREILALRAETLGYVSQFLRVIPRVATLDVVAGAAEDPAAGREHAALLLARLNIAERLWPVPPATFSGGEQQRVNIARGFLAERPILLLDEPTASLDAANRAIVIELIAEKKRRGVAIVAVVHDADVRDAIADRIVPISGHQQEAA